MRALALILVLAPSLAWAAPVKVSVSGKKSPGNAKVQAGLEKALGDQGAKVVTSGADFEIHISVKKAPKKKFVAEARLLAPDGRVVKIAKTIYAKGGAARAGAELGTTLGQAAVAERDNPRPVAPPPPPEPPPPAFKSIRTQPSEALTAESQTRPKPDPPSGQVEAELPSERGKKGAGGEDQMLRFSVGVGTQALSAYTVAVDGQVTGLAYTLTPLLLISLGARVKVPGTGLGIGLEGSFVPVQYDVNVDPPVDPAQPSGRFLSIGGDVSYELVLSKFGGGGRFGIAPLVGGRYVAMSVEAQGDNTVVVSYSGIHLLGGLRLLIMPSSTLAIEAGAEGGLVVGYSESPAPTGESASGFSLGFGGKGRFWLSDLLGLQLGASYHFQQMGFTGAGTRVGFFGDPQLIDATVFSGDLKIEAGVVLAL